MSDIVLTEEMLSSLRDRIKPYLSAKRYSHTLGVEKECEKLGMIFLPDKVMKLRAAALLHDITKMLSLEKQLNYCGEFGIMYGKDELSSPKLFHAITAAELIKRDFHDCVDDEIVSGVRWHTTGRRGMTLFEAIVYLADYIEETREFEDCVELRRYFYGLMEREETPPSALYKTMIKSFDLTIRGLINDGQPVAIDTVDARNYYIGLNKEII
ncbi:MAG: bis(5'-nucleosyl)-tetraphosphatase (symmetrical) YqeK [Clostridia bacterium]|nr:bis(5'-nucleosyl)-tetraphosphatase (symmetrical) YqeK [Clostridia bacterium]